ncbi:PucR family transcriptional regulator [Nocardia asteroides]|uniref:PucR family transcriptional regulator n=1 Tax=Nocardia asteroides TaxID=1824 RepID=UPI00378E0843
MPHPVPGPPMVVVANSLLDRLDELTDELVVRIADQVEIYRGPGVVSPAQLRRSTRSNLEYMLRRLVADRLPVNLEPPRLTGRERAEQGAPLPDVLRAFRIGAAFLWQQLLTTARGSGPRALDALLDTATGIWAMADDYSTALTESYRCAVGEALIAADRRRSALVEALLDGPACESHTAWEVARLLEMPYEGSFLVVFAETPELGQAALPHLEERLRALDVTSAWRTRPDNEIGILSFGRRRTAEQVCEVIARSTVGRVGVSPRFDRLDHTPRALRFAQIALETMDPGAVGIRQLGDTPLTDLVTGNRETTRRFVHRVLGGLLAVSDDDRGILITTAEAWLNARTSAADAARVLYCHENTVRYRMRRLEEHLDGSLDDPMTIAELTTALQAIRTFPGLGIPYARKDIG